MLLVYEFLLFHIIVGVCIDVGLRSSVSFVVGVGIGFGVGVGVNIFVCWFKCECQCWLLVLEFMLV